VLLQEVWGYNSGVTTHALESHIYRLRQKVETDAANPAILVTDARLQTGAPERADTATCCPKYHPSTGSDTANYAALQGLISQLSQQLNACARVTLR
jgi:hypothetical protein